jgi:hypothetical protein
VLLGTATGSGTGAAGGTANGAIVSVAVDGTEAIEGAVPRALARDTDGAEGTETAGAGTTSLEACTPAPVDTAGGGGSTDGRTAAGGGRAVGKAGNGALDELIAVAGGGRAAANVGMPRLAGRAGDRSRVLADAVGEGVADDGFNGTEARLLLTATEDVTALALTRAGPHSSDDESKGCAAAIWGPVLLPGPRLDTLE